MPYNGSGIFTIVNTFSPGTTIASSPMNGNFSDVATGLSNALTRDGQAPMTAALKLINGNSSVPSLTFASEPTLGFYRSTTETMGLAGALSTTGDVAVGGALTVGGNPFLPIGLGPLQWTGRTAPPLWVLAGATYNRADYPALWSFAQTEIAAGNTFYTNGNGSTTFTIATMDGYVPAGVDASGTRIGSFTHVGDTAGSPTQTLVTANLPAYTPSGSVTVSQTNTIDQLLVNGTGAQSLGNGGTASGFGWSSLPTKTNLAAMLNGFFTSPFTGNPQGGTSTPVTVVQSSRAFKYIVYAGV